MVKETLSARTVSTRARAQKLVENRRYHHGDLHDALIRAGDEILQERGADGFSLREAARRAGVSPAAPAYHFGNARGLLSEIAALGFAELTQFMRAELAKAGNNPADRLAATGRGYARFSFLYPGRFRLMFSRERLNFKIPSLQHNADQAFGILRTAIDELRDWGSGRDRLASKSECLMMAWCVVHGFASLVFHRQLDRLADEMGHHDDRSEFFAHAANNILTAFAHMLAEHAGPIRAMNEAGAA